MFYLFSRPSHSGCCKCFLTARRAEARFTLLKQEGNDLVKRGEFENAVEKYSECIALKPAECTVYTNRYELAADPDTETQRSVHHHHIYTTRFQLLRSQSSDLIVCQVNLQLFKILKTQKAQF